MFCYMSISPLLVVVLNVMTCLLHTENWEYCVNKQLMSFQELKILKAPGEKLGISIRGGARGLPGNPLDKKDEGIFISKVSHFII